MCNLAHGRVHAQEAKNTGWATGVADVDVDAVFAGDFDVVAPLLKGTRNRADDRISPADGNGNIAGGGQRGRGWACVHDALHAKAGVFEALGVWSKVAASAAPIRHIHVSDAGRYGFARLEAAEHGIEAFGYVVTNRVLGAALQQRLSALTELELRRPARCSAVTLGSEFVRLETSPDAPPLQARLVVAADGANSVVRSAAGLPAEIEDYQQVAVVAHVAAGRAADGIAYERFTPDGPFAVLPLHDGHYGVVWTLAPQAAEQVMALPDAEYLSALQRAFGWRIGRFERVGQRSACPLKLTRASVVTGPRVALIGNAAQALHPVAGQGFNLGLRDAATLAEVLAELRRTDPQAAGIDGQPDGAAGRTTKLVGDLLIAKPDAAALSCLACWRWHLRSDAARCGAFPPRSIARHAG